MSELDKVWVGDGLGPDGPLAREVRHQEVDARVGPKRDVPPGTEVFPQTPIEAAPAGYEPTAPAALLGVGNDPIVELRALKARACELSSLVCECGHALGLHDAEWTYCVGLIGVPDGERCDCTVFRAATAEGASDAG